MALKRTSSNPAVSGYHAVVSPRSGGEAARQALEKLAAMGGGEVGYLKAFRAGELQHLFPQIAELHPSVQLYGLFAADGTPLMLADSRESVLSGAWQNDLSLTAVH